MTSADVSGMGLLCDPKKAPCYEATRNRPQLNERRGVVKLLSLLYCTYNMVQYLYVYVKSMWVYIYIHI